MMSQSYHKTIVGQYCVTIFHIQKRLYSLLMKRINLTKYNSFFFFNNFVKSWLAFALFRIIQVRLETFSYKHLHH